MAITPTLQTFLFGGDKPWNASDWTSSDDRVRNGSSVSYLAIDPNLPTAQFHGNLDIKTLGGAGFASQRTTGEDRNWDLSSYDGIELDIAKSDGKHYTLTVKDQLLPHSANGREQATISWEYDFMPKDDGEKIFLTWKDLNATYRGKAVKNPKPLELESLKRFSLMMRSFFGTQEGDFSMTIASISAVTNTTKYRDNPNQEDLRGSIIDEKPQRIMNKPKQQSWLDWLRSCLLL